MILQKDISLKRDNKPEKEANGGSLSIWARYSVPRIRFVRHFSCPGFLDKIRGYSRR